MSKLKGKIVKQSSVIYHKILKLKKVKKKKAKWYIYVYIDNCVVVKTFLHKTAFYVIQPCSNFKAQYTNTWLSTIY